MISTAFCLVALLPMSGPLYQVNQMPAPNELSEFFGPSVLSALDPLGWLWRRRADHFYSSSPAVARNRIPDKEIVPCEMWMRKIMKPQFIPANLNSLWHGIKMAPDRDLIVASYSVQQYSISWIDMQGQIAVILRNNLASPAPDNEMGIKSLLETVPSTFFKMPADWRTSFKVYTARRAFDNVDLWYGCTMDHAQVDERYRPLEKENWYTWCPYFTDGATIYYELSAVEDGRWLGWNYGVTKHRLPERD